jgi:hypothetical protein
MRVSRCSVAVAVTLAAVVWSQGFSVADAAESNQAPQPQLSAPDHGSARNAVVIGWTGPLALDQAAALQSLLASELAGHRPDRTIGLQTVRGAPEMWIANARRDPRALLVALLELRVSGAWRIYLVDAARNRAIVRDLPGEAAGNSAALESVASVVSSAVRALDEGLEIASRPLAEVVGGPAPEAQDHSRTDAPVVRRVRLGGSVATALSTFAVRSPLTLGLCMSLRLVLPSALLLRLSATPSWPASFQSEYGSFEVQRTQAELSLGVETVRGSWHLSVEGGPAFELLRRRALHAQPGASARDSSNLVRVGPALMLGARYQFSGRLALEMALTGAYFPQRVRYTLAPANESVLGSPWLMTGTARLGLEFSLLP